MKKYYHKEDIISLLKNRDDALIHGLMSLYNSQSSREKSTGKLIENDNKGFNKVDFKCLSEMALYYKSNESFSIDQLKILREKLVKYANQLAKIANNNANNSDQIKNKKYVIDSYLLSKDNIENDYIYTITSTQLGMKKGEWPPIISIELKNPKSKMGDFNLLSIDSNKKKKINFGKYIHAITGEILIIFNE